MKVPSFLRVFGKSGSRGATGRRPRRRAAGDRPAPLRLDLLEDRTLLATLPPPQVLGQPFLPVFGGGHNFAPAVAVDPIDPQRAVAVWSGRIQPVPQNPPRIIL